MTTGLRGQILSRFRLRAVIRIILRKRKTLTQYSEPAMGKIWFTDGLVLPA
ncbi:hypothetical protein HMPREF0201_04131 [Cedecea davisae DSM 4568]|uniref:Uncharacterized protein n=1 Tax=Cedecea davisae DSM 4568 TaxID=566551 RepID=S3J1V1_9ENTR|nr:hypothetical protein HMPREF0201_04131 [Cedecea davisae DSM 4568]